jgi:glutathione synthase/RimK-type ligase-like ATP-grasp enzyme
VARKRILYLFPDRSSDTLRRWEAEVFWPDYREAADRVGLDFDVAAPDHIVIARRTAYWNGEELSPDRDIPVYGVRTGPYHYVDTWTGMSVLKSLESLGFWPAIPLDAGILLNDKFATLSTFADSPVPIIPSVRLTADRDIHRIGYRHLVPDEWFPVFVKPTSWSGGLGCVPCGDRPALDAVLGLAAGAGTAVVIQPSVRDVVADIRVVTVEGQIVAMFDRVPRDGSLVANASRGGAASVRTEIDPRVHDLIKLIQDRLDLGYFCVDLLLTAGGELWLSELEADGATSRRLCPIDLLYEIVGTRFRAYERRLAAFRAAVPR